MAVAFADKLTSALSSALRSTPARLSTKAPSRTRPLAVPPPGSGLRPVPGDFGLPLIGHALDRLSNLLEASRGRYERYGPVEWGGMLGTRIVGVYGPEATEQVATNRDKAFSNGGLDEYLIGPFFHRGLLLGRPQPRRLAPRKGLARL